MQKTGNCISPRMILEDHRSVNTTRVASLLKYILPFAFSFALVFTATTLITSCCAPNELAMDALNDGWEKIEPYAVFGVESDDGLTDDEERIIMQSLKDFGDLIDEAVSAAKEGAW